jgi:hypothetical protein
MPQVFLFLFYLFTQNSQNWNISAKILEKIVPIFSKSASFSFDSNIFNTQNNYNPHYFSSKF